MRNVNIIRGVGVFVAIVLSLLCIGAVQAALTDGIVAYWTFDNANSNSTSVFDVASGKYNITAYGAFNRSYTPAIVNQGWNFTYVSNASVQNMPFDMPGGQETYSAWLYSPGNASEIDLFGQTPNTVSTCGLQINQGGVAGTITWVINASSASLSVTGYTNITNAKGWGLWSITKNGTDFRMYFNGTLIKSASVAGASCTSSPAYFNFGTNGAVGRLVYGNAIDEAGAWNTSKSAYELETLWSYGTNGTQYPFLPTTSNMTFTAFNGYDNSAVSQYTVDVTFNGTNTTYNTLTGTIVTNVQRTPLNYLINFTIHDAIDATGGYFNITILNYNTTNNYAANLTQAQANFLSWMVMSNRTVQIGTPNVNTTLASDTSGNADLNLRAGQYNVTFSKSGYFNVTQQFTVPAISNASYNFDVWDRQLNITVADQYNSTGINVYNITITSNKYTNTTTYIISSTSNNITIPISKASLPPPQDNYTILVNAQNYFNNITNQYTWSNTSGTINYTINNVPYTLITAFSNNTNAQILNFTINATNIASTNESYMFNTSNGIIYLPLYSATYTINITNAQNWPINYTATQYNATSNPYTRFVNFSLFLSNTIFFSIYDEDTQTIINTTTSTLQLTGALGSYNISTTNGTANISLIIPQEYFVTTSASGYTTRGYYFILINQSINTLPLYLLKSSVATAFQNTVVSLSGNKPVAGADVYLERKNLTGTNYYIAEICRTSSTGICFTSVELYSVNTSAVYNVFIIQNGTLLYTLGDSKLGTNTLTYQVNTGNTILRTFFNYQNLQYSFNNTSTTFNAIYTDPYNVVTGGCIVVSQRTGVTSTTLNSTCTTGSIGTIATGYTLSPTANELDGLFYVIINGQNTPVASISFVNTPSNPSYGEYGLLFIVLPVLITMLFGLGTNSPGLSMAIGGFVLFVCWSIGLTGFSQTAIGGVLVLVAVLLLKLRA